MTDISQLKPWLTKKNSKVRALFVGKAGSKEQASVYVCFFWRRGWLRVQPQRHWCSPVYFLLIVCKLQCSVSRIAHACAYDPSQTHALTNVGLLHPPHMHARMERLFVLPGAQFLLACAPGVVVGLFIVLVDRFIVLVGLFMVLVGLFVVLVGLFIVLVGLFIVLVGLFIVLPGAQFLLVLLERPHPSPYAPPVYLRVYTQIAFTVAAGSLSPKIELGITSKLSIGQAQSFLFSNFSKIHKVCVCVRVCVCVCLCVCVCVCVCVCKT
jgi:hypothetical protein